MRQLFVIGIPISGTMLLEWGLFSTAAILVGWIGTTALAAHQIALQSAAILFMIPFGISMAATVRVGHAVGRRDAIGTHRAGFSAMALGAGIMVALTVVVVTFRSVIPLMFLGDAAAAAGETAHLAAGLLLIGATWFVADGIQGVAAGALRGLNDTRVPLLYAAVSFWLVGFTSAYTLAFYTSLGVFGVWIGFSLSLWLFASLLTVRFRNLTGRGHLPAPP
jgi:MATE family multidrug resistance protein